LIKWLESISEKLSQFLLILLVGVQEIVERNVVLTGDEMKNTKMNSESKVVQVNIGDMAANHSPHPRSLGDLGEEWRNSDVLVHFSVTEDCGYADEAIFSGIDLTGSNKHSVGELKLCGYFLNKFSGLNLGLVNIRFRRMDIPNILQF
jgi:hypothetical protein